MSINQYIAESQYNKKSSGILLLDTRLNKGIHKVRETRG